MRLRPVRLRLALAAASIAAVPPAGAAYANGCVTAWAGDERPGPPQVVTVDLHDGPRVDGRKAQAYATYVVWDVTQLLRCVV